MWLSGTRHKYLHTYAYHTYKRHHTSLYMLPQSAWQCTLGSDKGSPSNNEGSPSSKTSRYVFDNNYTAANHYLLYARKHAPQADLKETERVYPPKSQERVEVGSADEEASPPPGLTVCTWANWPCVCVCKKSANHDGEIFSFKAHIPVYATECAWELK